MISCPAAAASMKGVYDRAGSLNIRLIYSIKKVKLQQTPTSILDKVSNPHNCRLNVVCFLDFFLIAQHEERPLYHGHMVTSRFYFGQQIVRVFGGPSHFHMETLQVRAGMCQLGPGLPTSHQKSLKHTIVHTFCDFSCQW